LAACGHDGDIATSKHYLSDGLFAHRCVVVQACHVYWVRSKLLCWHATSCVLSGCSRASRACTMGHGDQGGSTILGSHRSAWAQRRSADCTRLTTYIECCSLFLACLAHQGWLQWGKATSSLEMGSMVSPPSHCDIVIQARTHRPRIGVIACIRFDVTVLHGTCARSFYLASCAWARGPRA
jgi:hypothetical protein